MDSAEDTATAAAALAEELHGRYGGCAQMTLRALQETLGLDDGGAFRAASALSGGVAMSSEVCGALLGALMAVGLALGRRKLEPTAQSQDYARAMRAGIEIFDRFRETFGSVRCRDIHVKLFGRYYDLRDPAQWREFVESGARLKCSKVCAAAARIAAEILAAATREGSTSGR